MNILHIIHVGNPWWISDDLVMERVRKNYTPVSWFTYYLFIYVRLFKLGLKYIFDGHDFFVKLIWGFAFQKLCKWCFAISSGTSAVSRCCVVFQTWWSRCFTCWCSRRSFGLGSTGPEKRLTNSSVMETYFIDGWWWRT